MIRSVLILLLSACLLPGATPGRAEEQRFYIFGNSLIHHLSDTDETTMPHWLAMLAHAGGHGVRVDGQWGFLRDFTRAGPLDQWSFKQVKGVWRKGAGRFAKADYTAIMVNPANFIQYQAPDQPYDGENPDGASPLSALLALIDSHGQGRPILLYEGWADMGGITGRFPPRPRKLRSYHAVNAGAYHQWYETLVDQVKQARPEVDIRLIPVAKVLSELLSQTELKALPPETFYIDDAPHGTPALYLMAAAVTYAGVFGEAPPDMVLPTSIPDPVRQGWPEIARFIARAMGVAEERAEAAPENPAGPTAPADRAGDAQGARALGVANPSLALGLNGISDWSTQHPFVNLMKTARPWVGHKGAHWGAWSAEQLEKEGYLDAHGWPTRLPPGVDRLEAFLLTDQPKEASGLAGYYRVSWEGSGTLKIGGRARDMRYDGNSARFRYAPGEGLVSVIVLSTDPAGIGDNIRNITIVREGHTRLAELGVLFNPDWIAKIKDVRSVRYMDWMMTNASPVTGWETRPVPGDYTFARRGVPVEWLVALANQIGADPWFNMPHMATDDYVQNFAATVEATLDPRLKAHVEYSNELWNFTFPQTRWAADRAEERWGEGAKDGWMQYAGARAAEVMRIWAAQFARAPDRLERVVAVHTGWMGLEQPLLNAPLWVAETGGPAPIAHFDAYAVSGYFGFELGRDEEGGRLADLRVWIADSVDKAGAEARARGLQRRALDAAIAPIRYDAALDPAAQAIAQGSLAKLTQTLWPYHARVARDMGARLIMYEGGTHAVGQGAAVNDDELTRFFGRFNYSRQMAGLYDRALAAWRAQGGEMFNAFVDVAPHSKWGSWGALRYLEDDTARWRGLMAANAMPGAEGRDAGAFLHGGLLRATDAGGTLAGTPEEDIFLGGAGPDRFETGGGQDAVHGGGGRDVAVLAGARPEYRFAFEDGRLLALSDRHELRLISVEALEFTDEPGRVYRLDLSGQ
ncbi:MAG: type I secretion protein [Rhodobacterales bacterium]|nr:MAG: type I secretion protein [Rhodobacterales bacterium]